MFNLQTRAETVLGASFLGGQKDGARHITLRGPACEG